MLISLDSVTYKLNYGEESRILLHDINFAIANNTITTIVGPNGAGKTTLVRLILGLINPTSGTINRKKDVILGIYMYNMNDNTEKYVFTEKVVKDEQVQLTIKNNFRDLEIITLDCYTD